MLGIVCLSPVAITQLASTLNISGATAMAIVNYVNATSNVIMIISLIGIIFGVGGFSLALVQTIRAFSAKRGLIFTASW
ncbi:circular bacteriocin, circularin A/uberolysin family [Pseudolactococcus carnosus]|uniref:circular bacteriocin, circularin A/uberolysin family n=1 Tax=Pseudolactococcus carnosus TaxID=2749961 RepID=UPI00237BA23A|nr:circular bacteriocin, circularin A/uberolysin family [Lactococcus carnosus]